MPRATARNNISFNPSLHRVSTFIANVIAIARTSTRAQYSRGESQGLILHIPPLLLGQINITAAAALDSKADLGLALPPNPLVGITAKGIWAGVRIGLRSFEQVLYVGWGNSQPPAWPKLMVPPPPQVLRLAWV